MLRCGGRISQWEDSVDDGAQPAREEIEHGGEILRTAHRRTEDRQVFPKEREEFDARFAGGASVDHDASSGPHGIERPAQRLSPRRVYGEIDGAGAAQRLPPMGSCDS